MTGLVAVVNEHHAAVEADLLRYYGVDLLDLYRGGLSLRRLSVLLRALPRESATVQALDPSLSWGVAEHLAASTVDALHSILWTYLAAYRGKGQSAPPRPERVPRPGDPPQVEERGKMSDKSTVKAFFQRLGG